MLANALSMIPLDQTIPQVATDPNCTPQDHRRHFHSYPTQRWQYLCIVQRLNWAGETMNRLHHHALGGIVECTGRRFEQHVRIAVRHPGGNVGGGAGRSTGARSMRSPRTPSAILAPGRKISCGKLPIAACHRRISTRSTSSTAIRPQRRGNFTAPPSLAKSLTERPMQRKP